MIPESTFHLLEFHKLLGIIAGHTHSDASHRSALALRPLDSAEAIADRVSLVQEIRRMAQEGDPLALDQFPDISGLLSKARPEGAVLEARELAMFVPFLRLAREVPLQVASHKGVTSLSKLSAGLTGFPDILRLLERSIDSEGEILDRASGALFDLRARTRALKGRIRRKLEEILRGRRVSVFLQDDFITERAGRWVIPVRMDSKGMVPGVVHDVSKSGETAFVEPLAIIPLANELENLMAEQKAEEIRILRAISSRIRAAGPEMTREFETVVYLDVLNGVATLADRLRMEAPGITETRSIRLVRARHPLLAWTFVKTGGAREVVPLDVHLGGDTTAMIITGSNAGGKTVAIKTVGILLLMALSGMPVPADSSSTFPLAKTLLIDIGDEQSIESSLSTFSAHVANISSILSTADADSMVLIDELGTGTDPDEGTALACAVLKELRQSGALTFATTHLTGIKGFVHREEGMINAAMEFDRKTLSPLYRLRTGEPGQSYALETARRYGLPGHVVDSARQMLNGAGHEFETLMADLNQKRRQHEEALEEVRLRLSEVERMRAALEQQQADARAAAREALREARLEASSLVTRTRQEMHALLDEMKKADRVRAREVARQAASAHEEILRKLAEEEGKEEGMPSIDRIMEGDVVFVKSLGYDAPVIEVDLKHNRLRLQAGSKEVQVPLSDIGLRRGKPFGAGRLTETETKEASPSSTINLIGMRVDEALSRLEPFLNHASLSGLQELTVIHGIGKGLLARAVREHLKGHPLAKHFRPGAQAEGGGGVTVVSLA